MLRPPGKSTFQRVELPAGCAVSFRLPGFASFQPRQVGVGFGDAAVFESFLIL